MSWKELENIQIPTVSLRTFNINKYTPYNLRHNNHLQQFEFQTVRYRFKLFRSYGSNCGTPSKQRSSNLKTYTILKKISLNGVFRVNVTCSSYSDTYGILPSTRNLSHYFIGFFCSSIYIQLLYTRLCQVLLEQVCMCSCPSPDHGPTMVMCPTYFHTAKCMSICSFSFYINICISYFHVIKDKMAVVIHYMLNSWCIIYAQFYFWFFDVFPFFSYTDFYFWMIRWSHFYWFHVL